MKQFLAPYKQVFSYTGSKSLFAVSLLARLTNIPLGAILTLTGYEITHSWFWAALVGGVAAAASVPATWMGGRAMDVWSPRKVMLFFLPGSFVPLLFLLRPTVAMLVVVAGLVGITRPPTGTTMRTAWQRLVPEGSARVAAYSLDSALIPLSGALGAVLGGIFLSFFGLVGIVLFLVVSTAIACLGLALHRTAEKGGGRNSMRSKGEKWPLGRGVWLAVLAVGFSWAAFVGVELASGVKFGPQALAAATALGLVAVAVGALSSSAFSDKTGRTSLVTGVVLAASALLIFALGVVFFWPLCLLAICALGVGRGMMSSGGVSYISVVAPEERKSEAMGLYGAGVLTGQGIYRSMASLLIFAPFLLPLIPALLLLSLLPWLHREGA